MVCNLYYVRKTLVFAFTYAPVHSIDVSKQTVYSDIVIIFLYNMQRCCHASKFFLSFL